MFVVVATHLASSIRPAWASIVAADPGRSLISSNSPSVSCSASRGCLADATLPTSCRAPRDELTQCSWVEPSACPSATAYAAMFSEWSTRVQRLGVDRRRRARRGARLLLWSPPASSSDGDLAGDGAHVLAVVLGPVERGVGARRGRWTARRRGAGGDAAAETVTASGQDPVARRSVRRARRSAARRTAWSPAAAARIPAPIGRTQSDGGSNPRRSADTRAAPRRRRRGRRRR